MIKLNLGSGIHIKRGFINVDAYISEKELKERQGKYKNTKWEKGAKFVQADICEMPFPDNYADVAEAHQTLEHLNFDRVIPAFREIHRVLKKGGIFYFDVPDFNELCSNWLYQETVGRPFDIDRYHFYAEEFYGNQAHGGEFHHVPMTVDFLNFCFANSGFTKIAYMKYDRNERLTKDLRKMTMMTTRIPNYMKDDDKFRCGTIFGKVIK